MRALQMSSSGATSAAVSPTAQSSGLSIAILAAAGFIVITTEYLIVGFLPALARDLDVSISVAGQLVTLFAFIVMICGPVLTAWLSHLERKRLFVVILLIFAASNAMSALAPNIWLLGLSRLFPALVLPVFWGTASETAGTIAGPAHAGKAVSRVYLGISAALVFGIPLGTVASTAIGWRGAFWVMAALSLTIALLMMAVMPTLERPARTRIREQARILRSPYFLANMALSVLVFTAMFAAYTYLADTLERLVLIPQSHVGWWLMGFGGVGLIGNWLGGKFVDRSPLIMTAVFSLLLAIGVSSAVPAAGQSIALFTGALAIWGISYTALFPICQIRVMKSASHAQALAGTLNVSAANAGVGLGAILGGVAIPAWGLASINNVAAIAALLAVAMSPLVARLRRS